MSTTSYFWSWPSSRKIYFYPSSMESLTLSTHWCVFSHVLFGFLTYHVTFFSPIAFLQSNSGFYWIEWVLYFRSTQGLLKISVCLCVQLLEWQEAGDYVNYCELSKMETQKTPKEGTMEREDKEHRYWACNIGDATLGQWRKFISAFANQRMPN